MLNDIKILLGITDTSKDALLNLLISICSEEFLNITHTNVVVNSVVEQMVIYKYNRVGAEGLTSESYSNFRNEYSVNTYSPELRNQILSHRRVRIVQ